MAKVDLVTLSVVWGGLLSATQEMGIALRRTAHSMMVREGHDFSTAVFDASTRLVAQGNDSPAHLGSTPNAMKVVIQEYPPETINPGDVILQNDPEIGAGHLPDFCMFYPVFYNDRLAGWTVSIAHQVDIGGIGPGSLAVANLIDFYQEGLHIMPLKLYEGGKLNEGVMKLIRSNSRLPDQVEGDINAMLNACWVGATQLTGLLDTYGIEAYQVCTDEIISRSEAVIRDSIRSIPDGTYTFEDYIDDTGPGTEPVKLQAKVTIKDDEITVDFEGTDPQRKCGMNGYYNYAFAYAIFALRTVINTTLPQNEGTLRPFKVIIPKGCILNAERPAACGARHLLCIPIFEVVMGAIAQAMPDRAIAAMASGTISSIYGYDSKRSKWFVTLIWGVGGGTGARSCKDGLESTVCPPAVTFPATELIEAEFPVLTVRREYLTDSAGAGKYRGALGVRSEYHLLSDNAKLYNAGERDKFLPWGLFGGKLGSKGSIVLNPGPHEKTLYCKGEYDIKKGDVVLYYSTGAGGYGDPLERDAQAVLRDVIGEYVSIEGAKRDYGVVIDSETMTVDEQKTRILRSHKD